MRAPKIVFIGADFVINSLAIERCELWKHDFAIPKKYGIRHCLGENGGPGALFFTMRTLPLIIDVVRDMEELCPNAWFLNFSNPETRLVLGVNLHSHIRCAGLCHGIFMARHDMAQMLGRDPEDVDVFAAGMNHFQWVLSVRDRQTGDGLYPLLREKELAYNPAFEPYSRKLFHFLTKRATPTASTTNAYSSSARDGRAARSKTCWSLTRRRALPLMAWATTGARPPCERAALPTARWSCWTPSQSRIRSAASLCKKSVNT